MWLARGGYQDLPGPTTTYQDLPNTYRDWIIGLMDSWICGLMGGSVGMREWENDGSGIRLRLTSARKALDGGCLIGVVFAGLVFAGQWLRGDGLYPWGDFQTIKPRSDASDWSGDAYDGFGFSNHFQPFSNLLRFLGR